jgi:O-antigen ligase
VQSNRYAYWEVAAGAFADAPLTGEGSGSFRAVWLRERPFVESVRDAHSLYVETAAELGLVGLVLLLALIAAVAVRVSPRTATASAGAAVFAVHAGVDWDWELPALGLVALALAARVIAAPSPARAAAADGGAP